MWSLFYYNSWICIDTASAPYYTMMSTVILGLKLMQLHLQYEYFKHPYLASFA